MSLVLGGISSIFANCAVAQIIPDNTLKSTERSVVNLNPNNLNMDVIEGGANRGANLFHSFQQFSVLTGRTAFFNNNSNIQNIITRVTGQSFSNIQGTIQTNGTANLFLINPNGIVFGPNATLNINGSFVASTANSVLFTDGTVFSATAPQTSPLLTVSVPIGLQLGSTPKDIVNQSQASPNGAVNSSGLPVGLQVPSGKTLALIGGNITLNGGNLTATGGQVDLGSVAGTGLVTLIPTDKGYSLGYAGIQNFGEIKLSQGAYVDASGDAGGNIFVQGGRMTLTDASQIISNTISQNGGEVSIRASQLNLDGGSGISTLATGAGRGGNVTVNATDSVTLSGATPDGQITSGFSVATTANGDAGTLRIDTGKLIVQGGAQVQNVTLGSGNAGDLLVKATDSVTLTGTTPDGQSSSSLTTQTQGTGNGGTLRVDTGKLIVRDGAQVQATTYSSGNAGALIVKATDSVELSGISPITPTNGLQPIQSSLTTQAFTGATGDAGNITITTGKLSVRDGASVRAATAAGTGGDLTVVATNLVELTGTSNNPLFSSVLTTTTSSNKNGGNLNIDTKQLIVQGGAQIFTNTYGGGNSGNLTVNALESVEVLGTAAANITILSQLGASSSPQATGDAGNITVIAPTIRLDNLGGIFTQSNSGKGGNITLQAQDLLTLRHNSTISSSAGIGDPSTGIPQLGGSGGNLTLHVGPLIALENSNITANAHTGSGGNIQIKTLGLFHSPDSAITASSTYGVNGVVNITTLGFDVSNVLTLIRGNLIVVSQAIASSCIGNRNRERGSFTVTGTGNLPVNPYNDFDRWYAIPGAGTLTSRGSSQQSHVANNHSPVTLPNWKIGDPIVEAQGIIVTPDGRTLLGTKAMTMSQARELVCHPDENSQKP